MSGESMKAALEKIEERYRASSNGYYPEREFPSERGRGWHEGFHTALATCSLIASEGLDPEGFAESERLERLGARGSDKEWFDATGNCGHCGMVAHDCTCSDDDPCGCGPHEPRTWPKDCWACGGTGVQDPLKKNRVAS